jgi:hypothetical protein
MWHVGRCASGLRAARKRAGGRVIGLQLACWELCHPDPALPAKDLCHFAQGKLRRESRPWIEETLFHWASALPRSFVVPRKWGLLRSDFRSDQIGPPDSLDRRLQPSEMTARARKTTRGVGNWNQRRFLGTRRTPITCLRLGRWLPAP